MKKSPKLAAVSGIGDKVNFKEKGMKGIPVESLQVHGLRGYSLFRETNRCRTRTEAAYEETI